MKRYFRFRHALATVLLLLSAAALFLWPWSYLHDTWLQRTAFCYPHGREQLLRTRSLGVRRGYFVFELYSVPPPLTRHDTPEAFCWFVLDAPLEKGRRSGLPFPLGTIRSSSGWCDTRDYLGLIVSRFDNSYPDFDGGPPLHTTGAVVGLPFWFLAPALSLSAAALVAGIYRRRPRPGLCPACGYDLRATPDRCPECGTIAAVKATA